MIKGITKQQEMVRRIHGISSAVVRARLKEGIPMEEAIRPMPRRDPKSREVTLTDEEIRIIKDHGLPIGLVKQRIRSGNCTREEALTLPIGGKRKLLQMQRIKEYKESISGGSK